MGFFEDGGYSDGLTYQSSTPQYGVPPPQVQNSEPVKEMRTYIREGTTIKEEYERLNPDGTVTKTVSVGDKRDGLKQFEVYKMDKSGIVRKIDPSKADIHITEISKNDDKYTWLNELTKLAQGARTQKYKQPGEYERDPNVYSDRMQAQSNAAEDFTGGNHPSIDDFTPEQKTAIFNRYKDKLLDYGSNRLKILLQQRLNNVKGSYKLSEEQKDDLLEYGIKKLHKQLIKNLDEQKFFNEIRPMYENMIGDANTHQVSFNLQPSDSSKTEESQKPVTFVIRPEIKSNFYPEKESKNSTEDYGRELYKTIWKDIHNGVSADELDADERKTSPRNTDEPSKQDTYKMFWKDQKDKRKEHEDDMFYETKSQKRKGEKMDDVDKLDKSLSDLEKGLRRFVRDDKRYDESVKQKKEELIDHTMTKLKELAKRRAGKEEKIKTKDEKHKKKYEDFADDNDESMFENGLRLLKKLLKKKTNEESLNNDFEEDDYLTKEEKSKSYPKESHSHKIKSSFSKQCKHSDDYDDDDDDYIVFRPKIKSKVKHDDPEYEKDEEKQRWSFNSVLNPFQEFFGKLKKPLEETKTSKQDLNDKTYIAYENPQQNSTSKTESSSQKESKTFDLSSFISKCYDIMNERAKLNGYAQVNEPGQDKNSFHFKKVPKQESTDTESKVEERIRKPVDVDSIISRIRQTMNQNSSNSKYQQASNVDQNQSNVDLKFKNDSAGFHQNAQNNNNGWYSSFHINPKDPLKQTKPNQISGSKSSLMDDDFLPWWFNKATSPNLSDGRPLFKRPVVPTPSLEESFPNNPLINGKLFTPRLANKLFSSMNDDLRLP